MVRSFEFLWCYKKIAKRFDCVISPERSDLAYYKFCNVMIDTVLAHE